MKTIKVVAFTSLVWLFLLSQGAAMERWAALSMIESGDNDYAVGSCGEISRFQIRPALWPGGNPQNEAQSLVVAQTIMKHRLAVFERTHKRPATDFEFYILWNAPAEVDSPSKIVSKRAYRFTNLVQQWSVCQWAKAQ